MFFLALWFFPPWWWRIYGPPRSTQRTSQKTAFFILIHFFDKIVRGFTSSPCGSGARRFSYSVFTWVTLPRGKTAKAWSWPLACNQCPDQENVDVYIHSAIHHHGVLLSLLTATATSLYLTNKTNSVALSLRANYTDWATATCRRNLVPTFVGRGVSRGQRGGSPTVVNLSFLDRSRYFSFK
jgi:hypothetical protein